jgi:WD40 repeat protein
MKRHTWQCLQLDAVASLKQSLACRVVQSCVMAHGKIYIVWDDGGLEILDVETLLLKKESEKGATRVQNMRLLGDDLLVESSDDLEKVNFEVRAKNANVKAKYDLPSKSLFVVEDKAVSLVNRAIRLYELENGKVKRDIINAHTSTIHKGVVCKLGDEKVLFASLGYDQTVKIWELLSGKCVLEHQLEIPMQTIGRLAVSAQSLAFAQGNKIFLVKYDESKSAQSQSQEKMEVIDQKRFEGFDLLDSGELIGWDGKMLWLRKHNGVYEEYNLSGNITCFEKGNNNMMLFALDNGKVVVMNGCGRGFNEVEVLKGAISRLVWQKSNNVLICFGEDELPGIIFGSGTTLKI